MNWRKIYLSSREKRKNGNGRKEKKKSLEQRIEQIKTRLEGGGVEKAAAVQMLGDIREIRVHEWQLEFCFDPLRMLHIPDTDKDNAQMLQEILHKEFMIWVDYPFSSETERGRYLDRRKIIEQIRKNPSSTAKSIAGEIGRSVYMVRNRIVELTRGGYLRFNGRGGRGTWEIVKELPEKEKAFKHGGL